MRSPSAIWLLCGAVALAGAGQWNLIQDRERGWLLYLAGGALVILALRLARDAVWPAGGAGEDSPLRTARAAGEAQASSLIIGAASATHGSDAVAPTPRARLLIRLGVGGIVALAAALRLVGLEGVPSGIHGDEGEFGSIALEILRGEGPPLFGVAFLDDPALYPHLLAPFVAILGANMTAIRLLSALAGTLTVLLFFLLVRDLGGTRAGLIAATLLAGSAVHIHFSRVALNVIEAPLFACLALWALHRGFATGRAWWYLAAGLAGGLGCYFHFSARIVAPILAVTLVWQLFVRRPRPLRAARDVALTGAGGFLALLPLLLNTLADPERLTGHMNSRLIWNHWDDTARSNGTTPDDWPGILREQAHATLAAIIQRPDDGGFYDFAGLPLIGALVAPLAILGLCALCARPRTPGTAALLPWFLVPFVFGGVLVINAGTFHRMLLVLLPALAAAALFLDRLIALVQGRLPARLGPALAGLLLLIAPLAAGQEARGYFGPTSAAYPWSDATSQARGLGALPAGTPVFVAGAPQIFADHGPSRYLGHALVRRNLFNPTAALPAAIGDRALVILLQPHNADWVPVVRAYYPEARHDEDRLPDGRVVLHRLTIPAHSVAAVPPPGLRGEIRPAKGTAVHRRTDPALAFMRLGEIVDDAAYEGTWEGRLLPPESGEYQLEIVTDGTITLLLDGAALIDDRDATQERRRITRTLALTAREYPVSVRGTWAGGEGQLALYWRKAGGERELIPPAAFLAPAPAQGAVPAPTIGARADDR